MTKKKSSVGVIFVGVLMFVLSILSFASWNAGIPFPFFPVAPLAFIGMGRLLQVLFWLIYLISI